MRVHRSFIVNLDKIDTIERSRIVFGKTYIPVSDQFKEKFQEYLDKKFHLIDGTGTTLIQKKPVMNNYHSRLFLNIFMMLKEAHLPVKRPSFYWVRGPSQTQASRRELFHHV
jgi:hypothetical protein